MKVQDIEAIEISGEGNTFVRDDYENNVELPGLAACLYLYDMNIQTTWFNCNKKDPNVDLHFSYSSLNEENKKIADELAQKGLIKIDYDRNLCYIAFPATLDDDVNEISNKLLMIAKLFKYQDVLYGFEKIDERFLYESFIKFGMATKEDLNDPNTLRSLISMYGYYDDENELIWKNEELFRKHQLYLESQKGRGSK